MGGTCSGEGNVVPEPPKTKLQVVASKIEYQIQDLDNKIAQAEVAIKGYVAQGKDNNAAKLRAVRLMKMKKMYEEQRSNLIGTQFNVEEMQAQQDQADVALTALQAMKASEEKMRLQQQHMPVDMVDELNLDMRQTAEDINLISAALAESGGALDGTDDAALEELAKLEAEMAREGPSPDLLATIPPAKAKPTGSQKPLQGGSSLFARRPLAAA